MTKKGGKRHSAEEIVKKLREAEALIVAGKQIAEAVQQLGVSEQTYYRWKTKYGGLKQGEAKRLEELEQENRRLKRLLADAELDKSILDRKSRRLNSSHGYI